MMDFPKEPTVRSQKRHYPSPGFQTDCSIDLNRGSALLLEIVGKGKRVLELGCARGEVSRLLAAQDCRVTGIEIDPAAADEARKYCDEVIVADLDIRPLDDLLPASNFDVALFHDVLERLRSPWQILEETKGVLGPSGYAVMSIANAAHGAIRLALLQGKFYHHEAGLLGDSQLRFFTARTMRAMCLQSGYRIARMERVKAPIFGSLGLLPRLEEHDFDPTVLAEIKNDPEHDTVQFIAKAVPLADGQSLRLLIEDLLDAESRQDKLTAKLTELESDAARSTNLREKLTASLREREELRTANRKLSDRLEELANRRTSPHFDSKSEGWVSKLEDIDGQVPALREQLSTALRQRDSVKAKNQGLKEQLRYAESLSALHEADAAVLKKSAGDDVESVDYLRPDELETAEAENLRKENAELRQLLQLVGTRSAAYRQPAEPESTETENLRKENAELRQLLQIADAELRASAGRRDELVHQFEAEQAHFSDVLARAKTDAERELFAVRGEMAAVDRMIQEIYRSPWWSLKKLIGGVARRRRSR